MTVLEITCIYTERQKTNKQKTAGRFGGLPRELQVSPNEEGRDHRKTRRTQLLRWEERLSEDSVLRRRILSTMSDASNKSRKIKTTSKHFTIWMLLVPLAWAEVMKWKVRTKLNTQNLSHNNTTGINDTFRQFFQTDLVIKEKIISIITGGEVWP